MFLKDHILINDVHPQRVHRYLEVCARVTNTPLTQRSQTTGTKRGRLRECPNRLAEAHQSRDSMGLYAVSRPASSGIHNCRTITTVPPCVKVAKRARPKPYAKQRGAEIELRRMDPVPASLLCGSCSRRARRGGALHPLALQLTPTYRASTRGPEAPSAQKRRSRRGSKEASPIFNRDRGRHGRDCSARPRKTNRLGKLRNKGPFLKR